jgi:two-component system chemotaxis response regulator CheB
VVIVGSSLGGPAALRELLGRLPSGFSAALLLVQHLPAAYTAILAEQLDRQGSIRVREAKAGDLLEPGTALVAPGDRHLLLGADASVRLVEAREIPGPCPSIDATMQSAVRLYGPRTSGVLLTGMGEDGVAGLLAIRARSGRTYVQSAPSCVVDSMPQRALERGAAQRVGRPAEIAGWLAASHPWLPGGTDVGSVAGR